jgi:uncharacterized protein (DUF2147 family)
MRAFAVAATLSLAAAPTLAAASPEGVWLVQDQSAKVRIGPCPAHAEQLCGDIIWVREKEGAPKQDVHNPDPQLRSRPIVGLPLIRDFHSAGPGRWEDGKIYDPRSGKTYRSKMELKDGATLEVDGCLAMFCQAQTWRRVG